MSERGVRRFVMTAMTSPFALPVLGGSLIAAVALGILEGLPDLRLGGGVGGAEHALAAAQRACRGQFAPGREIGMQDAAGQVQQQQAMVDLVEHPGQHAGLQRVRRRGGDVAAKALQVGDLEICCGFHAALLIWGDEKSVEDCDPDGR